jgi:hypothetical protein
LEACSGVLHAGEDTCCRIVIIKPECVASADETEITNMSQGSQAGKTKCERKVQKKAAPGEKAMDTGATLMNKSLCLASMYVWRLVLKHPGAIWSVKPRVAWMQAAPTSTAVAANGKLFLAM